VHCVRALVVTRGAGPCGGVSRATGQLAVRGHTVTLSAALRRSDASSRTGASQGGRTAPEWL